MLLWLVLILKLILQGSIVQIGEHTLRDTEQAAGGRNLKQGPGAGSMPECRQGWLGLALGSVGGLL